MLEAKLNRFIKRGRLALKIGGSDSRTFGEANSHADVPFVAVRLDGPATAFKLLAHPDLYLGEAYTSGALVMEQGTIWDLLELLGRNLELRPHRPAGFILRLARQAMAARQQRNAKRAAARNVSHHYDLSERLYRQFLDDDMQYSCAYFRRPELTLDEAQLAKKRHIAAKLALEPGQRVLDIGCGWGGLALSLAESAEVQVVGITLSREQLDVARQRAKQAGLQNRVSFQLLDYRDLSGTFDRIVSVGMFEHVGMPNYPDFFRALSGLLADDGVGLLHSIGRMRGPSLTSAWIRKHIFPGGYIPALSEVLPAFENAGLWLADLEVLRLHYAETLRHWRERFLRNAESLGDPYDAKFRRMWEFYLAVSEMAFRFGGFMVFQAQFTRSVGALPLVRDYMMEGPTIDGKAMAAE